MNTQEEKINKRAEEDYWAELENEQKKGDIQHYSNRCALRVLSECYGIPESGRKRWLEVGYQDNITRIVEFMESHSQFDELLPIEEAFSLIPLDDLIELEGCEESILTALQEKGYGSVFERFYALDAEGEIRALTLQVLWQLPFMVWSTGRLRLSKSECGDLVRLYAEVEDRVRSHNKPFENLDNLPEELGVRLARDKPPSYRDKPLSHYFYLLETRAS